MGTWDVGPFDNDAASDWAYDFEGADAAAGLAVVRRALDLGGAGEYVEADDAVHAVAAAAVVSWMRDPGSIDDDGEAAAAWVRTEQPTPDPQLVDAAVTALARVRAEESELAELWAENAEGEAAWKDSLSQIEARLR